MADHLNNAVLVGWLIVASSRAEPTIRRRQRTISEVQIRNPLSSPTRNKTRIVTSNIGEYAASSMTDKMLVSLRVMMVGRKEGGQRVLTVAALCRCGALFNRDRNKLCYAGSLSAYILDAAHR